MNATRVVAAHELRQLWLVGRGLPLMLAYAALLSVTSYLAASNRALNFLEQRETVTLTVQVAIAVAALLVLLTAADAISGERERGTFESLLLTPAPRWSLVAGKGIAALSTWAAAFVVSTPYVWYLGRGTAELGKALLTGLGVGFLLAVFLCGLGLAISSVTASNRTALSVSLFLLLAIFFPTQIPLSSQQSGFGDFLLRADPMTAGLRYVSQLLIRGHSPTADLGWLVGPAVAAVVMSAAAMAIGARLSLRANGRP